MKIHLPSVILGSILTILIVMIIQIDNSSLSNGEYLKADTTVINLDSVARELDSIANQIKK